MTEQTYSASSVQKELSQMAWEDLNRSRDLPTDAITLLQMHMRRMSDILTDPEKYRQMWERVKRGATS